MLCTRCHLTVTPSSCHLLPPKFKVAKCSFKGIIPIFSNILHKQRHLPVSLLHITHHQWLSAGICVSAETLHTQHTQAINSMFTSKCSQLTDTWDKDVQLMSRYDLQHFSTFLKWLYYIQWTWTNFLWWFF